MTVFDIDDNVLRFGLFFAVLIIMTLAETLMPRRERRFPRHQRWLTNFGILASSFLAVSVMTILVPVTAVLAALWAEAGPFGLLHMAGLPVWANWLIAFIVLDFVVWGQHVVTHRIPILWRIHRVHHTDEDLDASTAVRFHPIEIILSIFVKAGAVIVLGAPPEAVVLFEAMVNASALFNHANFKLPLWLDGVLRYLIVTPDMHRIHHSTINRETDSNFGFALSVWDRVFKTYTQDPEGGQDGMKIGLAEWQDDQPTRYGWTMLLPFRNPPKSPPQQKSD